MLDIVFGSVFCGKDCVMDNRIWFARNKKTRVVRE